MNFIMSIYFTWDYIRTSVHEDNFFSKLKNFTYLYLHFRNKCYGIASEALMVYLNLQFTLSSFNRIQQLCLPKIEIWIIVYKYLFERFKNNSQALPQEDLLNYMFALGYCTQTL